MALHDIARFISLIAIFISAIPFLKTLYEDYGKPDWRSCETVDETEARKKLEELIKKYNVPTELQKDLVAVTDKYFVIQWYYDNYSDAVHCFIYGRQPDGTLGDRKGTTWFERTGLAVWETDGLDRIRDDINALCDLEVERQRVMRDRFL